MTGFPVGYRKEVDSRSGYKVLGPILREVVWEFGGGFLGDDLGKYL